MNPYLEMWKNMFKFSGRKSKKDFGVCFLMNIVVTVLFSMLSVIFPRELYVIYGLLFTVYSIAIMIAMLALYSRRLHDINKSGLWAICAFIPVLSVILLVVAVFSAGTKGTNMYGIDPMDKNHFTLKNDDFFNDSF